MRLILGIILFWLSTFGYLILLKKKTKLPYELILPMIFTIIGILMFLAGILNIMKELSIIICVCGIVSFLYYLVKKEFKFKEILNFKFLIMFVLFLYLTIICSKLHLLHYDNFSHWGLIIKTMFIKNALPNFEDAVIEFKGYQPGSACFIYYFGLLTGKSEGSMIIAQNYLLIAYFFSLFAFTSENKDKRLNMLLQVLITSFYLFILFGNIAFNELLVDTLMSVIFIYSIVILFYFRDDLKKAFIYTLPISVYLFLVKNIGIVLVGFNCLGLLYLGIRNKEFKKSFVYALISGVTSVSFFFIWNKHVSYVYGSSSLYSKHSLSSSNILSELRSKGWSKIFEFCNIYFKHFIDVLNNMPNIYIIFINLFLLILILLYKNRRKDTLKVLIICDFIYLAYYGILGIMYLLSMPWDEILYLAGFDRYMFTIIFAIIGIVLIYFVSVVRTEDKTSKKSILLSIFLIIVSVGVSFKYNIYNYDLFLGNQNYEESYAYIYDQTLETEKFTANYDDFYYVYAPISSNNDNRYMTYLSKYKLNTVNRMVVKNISEIDDEIGDGYNKKIILIDYDNEIMNYINNHNYEKLNDRLYIKK